MDKKYILGTGNPQENLGHTVDLKLQWQNGKFEGRYSVHTKKYQGTGVWNIWPIHDPKIVCPPRPNTVDDAPSLLHNTVEEAPLASAAEQKVRKPEDHHLSSEEIELSNRNQEHPSSSSSSSSSYSNV